MTVNCVFLRLDSFCFYHFLCHQIEILLLYGNKLQAKMAEQGFFYARYLVKGSIFCQICSDGTL